MNRRIRSLAVLLAITVVTALAACQRSTPTGTPAAPGAPPGTGSPIVGIGDGPATGLPTAAPTTGAPVTTPPGGGSPHSTLANKSGFVWSSKPSESYTATGAYQYNSAGGAINITRSAVGKYLVSFVGLGSPGGIAHAQAYGNTSNHCNVGLWLNFGGNLNVAVNCFTSAGAPADTQFVADWAAGSEDNAMFAYAWADQASNPAPYHPSSAYRYDAVNSADVTVTRLSIGRYRVHLPVSALDEPAAPWSVQVTAYGNNNRCKLHGVDLGELAFGRVVVACRTPGGANVDSRFSISYHALGNMLGRLHVAASTVVWPTHTGPSLVGAGSVTSPGIGVYNADLPGVAAARGHVVALATGPNDVHCHIRSWLPAGSDLRATVVCYKASGAAATTGFLVSATW